MEYICTTDSVTQEISNLIRSFKPLLDQRLSLAQASTETILKTGSRDKHTIERTLDQLLDLWYHGKGKELHERLIAYYQNIDSEAAVDYQGYFDEIESEWEV